MIINGKNVPIEGTRPLKEVLIEAGFDPEAVALEKNSALVRRKDFDGTTVTDGDAIEVFSFTGGG